MTHARGQIEDENRQNQYETITSRERTSATETIVKIKQINTRNIVFSYDRPALAAVLNNNARVLFMNSGNAGGLVYDLF